MRVLKEVTEGEKIKKGERSRQLPTVPRAEFRRSAHVSTCAVITSSFFFGLYTFAGVQSPVSQDP